MTKKDIIYLSTSIISIGIIILWVFLGYNGKNINSFFSKSNNIQSIKKSNHVDSTNQENNIINTQKHIDTSKEIEIKNFTAIKINKEEDKKYDIQYVYNGNESFRDGTIKIKISLEENGYNYNKVKKENIKLFIDESKKSINWNDACNIYLNKLKPKKGDYLYFIK